MTLPTRTGQRPQPANLSRLRSTRPEGAQSMSSRSLSDAGRSLPVAPNQLGERLPAGLEVRLGNGLARP
jgi:hypothetical protein